MIVPLSAKLAPVDNAVANMGLCSAFVFGLPVDSDAQALIDHIHGAARRVVSKWSLLRGQPIWLDESESWGIDIPADAAGDNRPFLFSTARVQTTYAVAAALSTAPVPISSSSPSSFQPEPNLRFFRHAQLPSTFAGYAESGASLLAIHVTVFLDAVAVGVSAPHGLFDATGLGCAVQALRAELHDEAWLVPVPAPSNALDRAIEDVEDMTDDNGMVGLPGWVPATSLTPILKFVVNYVVEKVWHQDEKKHVFLSRRAVDRLVRNVKAEVVATTQGREWVSEGDVLTAWVLKNAHTDERNEGFVACSAVYTLRNLFSLGAYPHNAMLPYPVTRDPVSLSDLASMSIAQLALMHRRSLVQARTPCSAAALVARMRTAPLIPAHSWPWAGLGRFGRRDSRPPVFRWISSNQKASGVADLALPMSSCIPHAVDGGGRGGLPMYAYYMTVVSTVKDHQVFRFQANAFGVFLEGSMRRRRWRNVEMATQALERALHV